MTGDQGYAQGRLIVDIALFLETTGGLKSLISQWKRTKTFKIKDYLPQKPAPKAFGSGKTLDTAPGLPQGPLTISKQVESSRALKEGKTIGNIPALIPTEKKTLGTVGEVKTMAKAIENHVFSTDRLPTLKNGEIWKFKGGHTRESLEKLDGLGWKYRFTDLDINRETGVYQARPELSKMIDGKKVTAVRDGNNGVCTFFPDDWTQERILREVEHASQNIIGKHEYIRNGYIGLSIDGKIRIVIQYDEYVNKQGEIIKKITSYYPLFE